MAFKLLERTISELLIPFAIDAKTGAEISAEKIADRMRDARSQERLRSMADHDTANRTALHLICPMCHQRVYPHAPRVADGRYFYSHGPNLAAGCSLEKKRPKSPDDVARAIFHGRQEGEAHKNLVNLLTAMAERDAQTLAGSIRRGVYETPTDEMRAEFRYGRYPDVAFTFGEHKVVLEAQLAPISLYGINGRRAFYERSGQALLWVMRNFDPTSRMRAFLRDIIADQMGVLFAVDSEIATLSERDGTFQLRAWIYDFRDGRESWRSEILELDTAIKLIVPQSWADDFKQRWRAAFLGKNFSNDPDIPDTDPFLEEIAKRAEVDLAAMHVKERNMLLRLVRVLIALESGEPIGMSTANIIPIVNSFDYKGGHKARGLVELAVNHWAPQLLKVESVQQAFARAKSELDRSGGSEWGQRSPIGKFREVLFPEWKLEEAKRS